MIMSVTMVSLPAEVDFETRKESHGRVNVGVNFVSRTTAACQALMLDVADFVNCVQFAILRKITGPIYNQTSKTTVLVL